MSDLQNVFSWSKSRDEQFRDCQRKYFFDKYASWGGWEAAAPKETRMAYVLKNLKNRHAWKGETVHHVIEDVLKSMRGGKALSNEEASLRLTTIMRQDYRSSKAKKNWLDPKRNIGLFEHEYEKGISDEIWKEIHDSSAQCLQNFFQSSFYKALEQDDKSSWLVIEDLEEYNFGGAKIYVKLDFARKKDEFVEIYDWKTGKDNAPSDEAANIQLGTYAIYAMQRWSVPLEKIRTFLFYLSQPNPQPKEKLLTPELILKTKSFIESSIQGMKGLLLDPEKNIPKPREAFELTENTRLCNSCSFYKICERFRPG